MQGGKEEGIRHESKGSSMVDPSLGKGKCMIKREGEE